jgi:DNA-binding protein YbaB
MAGNNMFDMIKQAQQMKSQMAQIEKKLNAIRAEGEGIKGQAKVKAVVNGKQEIVLVNISDEAMQLKAADLSKLVTLAVERAQNEARKESQAIAKQLQFE